MIVRPTREALLEVEDVYSHAFCPDGLASAMICLASYATVQRTPKVHMVMYDTVDHEQVAATGRQLWTDITPPMVRWEEWKGASPIVLDHHETAKPAVEGLGGVYGGLEDSGASLAFRNVMRIICPDHKELESWAKFAHLAMVRDTWKDAHDDWEEACALANALGFYTEKAMLSAAEAGDLQLNEMLRFGAVLVRKTASKAFRLATTSTFAEAGGLKFGFYNCSEKVFSETGHELLEKHGCDVACGFFYTQEGGSLNMCVSMRSKKGGVSVSKIAEQFGGGGHQPAAGFRIKGAESVSFTELIRRVLEAAESTRAST